MNKKVQIMIQTFFLALFIFLTIQGMIQIWMGVFLLGVGLSPFFGRVYCGYACPINTAMKPVSHLKKKGRFSFIRTPSWLRKNWVRYAFLALFIGGFLFSAVTGNQLPLLPGLLVLGVLVALWMDEAFFHRYVCPYGTLLSFTARPSKKAVSIDASTCIGCGNCERVCPTEAVHHKAKLYWIESKECLTCMECARHCPVDAIHYQKAAD